MCRNGSGLRQGLLALVFLFVLFPLNPTALFGQIQPRVVEAVDNARRVTLTGNVHPLARPEFDRGPADDTLAMNRMLLLLKRGDAQESALQDFLGQQQDKSSANYHAWLTPQQFGAQYGPSDSDLQAVTQWLGSQGFRLEKVYNGKTIIEFSGTAGQVRTAFGTAIRNYQVNGKAYVANANDPQIPAALAPVVVGIVSLSNFPRRPLYHTVGIFKREKQTGRAILTEPENPELTFQCATNTTTNQPIYCNALVPYDFATIYNVLPLWKATPAIDGTGETIAIVAESNINPADVQNFRSSFGLPAYKPCTTPPTAGCLNVIVNGPDPGVIPGPETEADLDTEWAGGVAPNVMIDLVVSESTESSSGADLSSVYVVDNDLAPVMSVSFGNCELFLGATGNQFFANLWEQAAAEGISVFVASGDNGSAGCDFYLGTAPEPAKNGFAVNGLASTPFNIAVGGTDFNDILNETKYWRTTGNDPTTQQSVLSYVPEFAWNESCSSILFSIVGYSANAEANCNNTKLANWLVTVGGGGGQSSCTNPTGTTFTTCTGGYPVPSWQTGLNVPVNGGRAVPDVSLFAGAGLSGNAYALCEQDRAAGTCTTAFLAVGGTSAASPTIAAIMALVNQKTQSRQGNAGIVLYKLATTQTAANCNSDSAAGPASTCIFNDVTSGTNSMPCAKATPNCTTSNNLDSYGVLSGYSAGNGYDLATGLGSVNAQNLVNKWSSVTFLASTTTLTVNGSTTGPINVRHGTMVTVSSAVAAGTGATGTPTGQVALMATPNPTPGTAANLGPSLGIDVLALSGGSASSTGVILPGGTYTLTAHYQGDATFGQSNSPGISTTVAPEASKTLISIPTFNPTTGQETGNTPTTLVYGSPYAARIDVGNAQATLSFPPKAVCTPPNCPTGTIMWTDSINGGTATPLDGGSFVLNSEGYTEDIKIQLGGGTHVLSASYGGDNSYSSSSGTYSLMVTPAPTNLTLGVMINGPKQGVPFGLSVNGTAQTQSGAAPTGTVTFFDGSTQLAGPVSVSGSAGQMGSSPSFSAGATVTIPTGGSHTLSAQYSGDSNYAPSTVTTPVSVLYQTTSSISFSPSSVNYGSTVTITGVVNTTAPFSNAALKPTGAVYLSGSTDGQITNETATAISDVSGNWELQVTATITPSGSETFNLMYIGDLNYASSTATSSIVNVNIPDFALGPTGLSIAIASGQAGTGQVSITPLSQTPSTVNLSVGAFYTPGYSLAISPQQVSTSGTAATATVTVTPTISFPGSAIRSQTKHAGFLSLRSGDWRLVGLATAFGALFLLAFPVWHRKYRTALGLTAATLFLVILGCGGGGGYSGGGVGGGTLQATTTTITTSSSKVATNAPLTLTAIVTTTGSNPVTGTVDFHTPNGILAGGVPVVNGQAQLQAQGYFTTPGTFQLTAFYNGDSHNLPSQSSTLTQAITGTIPITVTGQTGTDTHVLQGTIVLQ